MKTGQLVAVSFKNSEDFLYKFKFKSELSSEEQWELIKEYFIKKHGFDEAEDNFTLLDKPLIVKL